MATTGGSVTLTAVGAAVTVQAPSLGPDFAAVQLQNSSVFVISALAGGETYTIQSFTAQTIPLASDAAPIVITPIADPSGEVAGIGSSLIPVWLLEGESPPMQDGPLTAAAIAAAITSQGIGTLVYGPAMPGADGVSVTPPPNSRTLIVVFVTPLFDAEVPELVQIAGTTSLIDYYNQPPYLIGPEGNTATIVTPIAGFVDTTILIEWTWAVAPPGGYTVAVYADTAEYDESIFYNGPMQSVSVTEAPDGTYPILSGPARLLTLSLEQAAAGSSDVVWFKGGVATAAILRADVGAGLAPAVPVMTFPPNTILKAGDSLELNVYGAAGSASNANVVWAYP